MFTKVDIENKNVLIRLDLDVPIERGVVTNNFRLQKVLPTVVECLKYAHKVCLIGHSGRPTKSDQRQYSLEPIKKELEKLLNQSILVISSGFPPGDWWKGESPLILLENLRFDDREENLSPEFAKELSTNADLYIYEAFATYRPCTSLSLIPKLLPTKTGLQFDSEISTLKSLLVSPKHPTLLIGSGSKQDKKELLQSIAAKFDHVFWGGVFALPEDLTADGFDINPQGLEKVLSLISASQTIVLNGPLGKYEDSVHSESTKKVFEALANSSKTTILGGGDTLAAIPYLGFNYTQYGFVSTGGGATLEFLKTETHPLLAILN